MLLRDISTDPIPEKSPEENSVIRPNRKKVRIQRSQNDNVENGTARPSHEFILECLTVPQKNKKQSRRNKKRSNEVEKVVDNNELCGSCSGSFKDDIRGENWIQCTNCDLWFTRNVSVWESMNGTSSALDANMNQINFFKIFYSVFEIFWTITKLNLVYHEIRRNS